MKRIIASILVLFGIGFILFMHFLVKSGNLGYFTDQFRAKSYFECNLGEPYPCDSNVFVGKVIKIISEGETGRYEIEVERNLKGQMSTTTVLDIPRVGSEGVDPLLQVGRTYQFVARNHSPEGEWYVGIVLSSRPDEVLMPLGWTWE